jgi:hypothetical protein
MLENWVKLNTEAHHIRSNDFKKLNFNFKIYFNKMKNILNRLINHETLSKDEAKDVLVNISNGSYNSSHCFILDRLHDA